MKYEIKSEEINDIKIMYMLWHPINTHKTTYGTRLQWYSGAHVWFVATSGKIASFTETKTN